MTPNPIFELAPEIWIEILKDLHFTDILACMQTCRTLLEILKGSSELNYQIQLQVAGLQDNPRCLLSLPERLAQLKERERRWNSFEWKTTFTFPVPHNTSNLFEISPSTLVMGIAPDLPGPGTKGLQTAQLNKLSINSEETSIVSILWKDFMFGYNIHEVGVAIEEHDLIACIVSSPNEINPMVSELSVFLFRFSTKDWHDACTTSILPLRTVKEANGSPSFTIEISGENLALTIIFHGRHQDMFDDTMFIYDWKTGRNKTPDGEPIMNAGLVFLQEDIIAHPNNIRKSIDLYYIPSSENFSSNSGTKVRLIRQLLLPVAPFYWLVTSFEVRSSPNPTGIFACPEFVSEARPFTNDPIRATVFFSMTMFLNIEETQDIRDFAIFTHRKALLDLVPWKRVADGNDSFDDLPWEQWGPPVTRWFSQIPTQVTTTSGQRYAMTIRSIEDPSEEHPNGRSNLNIQLLNFNPWTVKMARQGLLEGIEVIGDDERDSAGEEPEENMCSGSGVFLSDIVGRLPYVRTTKSVEWAYAAAMMNEEMLLGLTVKRGTHHLESMSMMYFG